MSGQQFPINLSGILVAALLVLAALVNQPPLRSERPPAAKIGAEPSGPFQDIPARIWEDPLEAVARGRPGGERDPIKVEIQLRQDGAKEDAGSADGARVMLDEKAAEAEATPPPPPNIIALYLRHLVPKDRVSRLLLLPVMVSGAPHPALREQRLRMRVAVHAGLSQSGFVPLRGDRLGNWTWRVGPGVAGKPAPQVDVPFEAFKKDRQIREGAWTRDLVLVLWINDEYLSQDLGRDAAGLDHAGNWLGPLSAFDALLERIGYPVQGTPPEPNREPDSWRPAYASAAVRLIGPASSDSLESIYRELKGMPGTSCIGAYRHLDNAPAASALSSAAQNEPNREPWGDNPVNFKLISPHATAPQDDLIGGDDIHNGPIQVPHGSSPSVGQPACATLEFHRTIATDDRLMGALIDELRLRGVDPISARGHGSWLPALLGGLQPSRLLEPGQTRPNPRDHVVLISEWDTKFGRTLPYLFEKRVRASTEPSLDPNRPVPWVHRFSYVRGLDGDTPAPAAGSQQGTKPDILSVAGGLDTGFKEPAVGTNQYDYLRRLTLQIADLDWSLKQRNQGSIKAFGILGNDYFDKLLILQALKERFPSNLYFTTDLDAGYLDAKVFRWTRNLVIAAPYGLTLHRAFDAAAAPNGGDDLQGGTPPFRHSYQTSLYLTVLRTLQGREAELGDWSRRDPPLLFEVGHGRFYQLKHAGDPPSEGSLRIQPDPTNTGVGPFLLNHATTLILVGGLALALILVSAPTLRRKGPVADSAPGPWAWLELRAVLLVTLFYLVVGGGWLTWAITRGEEPFAWFSGVSIWPSELVRLVAGWIAGLCLIYGWRRVRDTDQRIAQVFELADPRLETGRASKFSAWYRGESEPRGAAPARATAEAGADSTEPPAKAAPQDPGERPLAQRICRLFTGPDLAKGSAGGATRDAAAVWRHYLPHATLRARSARVVPMTLLFWLFALLLVYGFIDPLTPHRGLTAYLFDTLGGLMLVGLPFLALLFAAVDEARLCRGLLCRLEGAPLSWPIDTTKAGCDVEQQSRPAVDYWITTEFIAERTAPSAHLVHLPLLVTLFLLLSLSTRFDNWNTPASVIGLIALTVGIVLLASSRLRRCAQRIRQRVVDDLKEEVTGIEYAAAKTQSEKLRRLVERIEAIHQGAYTKWYNEPVIRALAWVVGIGIWILTEYAKVGG